MKSRFLAVRFFTGMFVAGAATPVNVPFAVQAQTADMAEAVARAPANAAPAQITAANVSGAADLGERPALTFGPHDELPRDNEGRTTNRPWQRNDIMAALGDGAPARAVAQEDSALAKALDETHPDNPAAAGQDAQFVSAGSGAGGFGGFGSSGGGSTPGTAGGSGSGATGGMPGTSTGTDNPLLGGGGGVAPVVTGSGAATDPGTTIGTTDLPPIVGPTAGGDSGTGNFGGTDGGPVPGLFNPIVPQAGGSGIVAPFNPAAGGSGSVTPAGPDIPPGGSGITAPSAPGVPAGGAVIVPSPPETIVAPPVQTGPAKGDASAGGPSPQQPPQNPVAAVPEPSSWATMLFGFAMIGAALRSRRRRAQA